jgi:hypothetical protein
MYTRIPQAINVLILIVYQKAPWKRMGLVDGL